MRRRKPSLTAYGIARAVDYIAALDPLAGLLPTGSGEVTVRLMQAAFRRYAVDHWLLRRRWIRPLAGFQERLFMPGILAHVALRKRWIDDLAARFLAADARSLPADLAAAVDPVRPGDRAQVVVLGAGFDTLCARLAPRHPDVTFVEVDHPSTQARKKRGLARAGLQCENLCLVAADLPDEELGRSLQSLASWGAERPTMVIAEGLTMYLSAEAVEGILELFRRGTGAGSRLVFTFMQPRREGRLMLDRMEWLTHIQLRMVGEAFGWGIARPELAGFLAARGLRLLAQPGADLLRRHYLAPAGLTEAKLAGFEHLAIAGHA